MKIIGLANFNLIEENLSGSLKNTPVNVKVYLVYYPELEKLKRLQPNERGKVIHEHLRKSYNELITKWPSKDFEKFGSHVKPRGLKGILTGAQILELSAFKIIDWIFIDDIPGRERVEKLEEQFFSVKALFAAEIEGFDYSDSVQLLEERILLVKALNREDAVKKLKPEFEAYEEEVLNVDKRFARWRFVEVQDIFEVGVSEIDPNGTEVFSVWKRRKLKNAIKNYQI